MYENEIMRPVETAPRKVGGGIKQNDGEGESKVNCEHFCKCDNVPQVQL
jgi:hypothetical protein